MSFPTFKLIQTPEKAAQVIHEAKQDGDSLINPSHVVERDGEIIGAASLGVIPLALVWNHSKKVQARDSMHLKLIYDSIMETKGFGNFIMACRKDSPYNESMQKLGYKPIWVTELFLGGTNVRS